jgi:hypothetical protein
MKRIRKLLEFGRKVRKKFPDDLHEISKFKEGEGSPTYYVSFLSLLIGVIWIGVVFIAWDII